MDVALSEGGSKHIQTRYEANFTSFLLDLISDQHQT